MNNVDTETVCKVCKTGKVVAQANSVWDGVEVAIGAQGGSKLIITFYCADCQVMYNSPPGKPNFRSELVSRIREEEAKKRWEAPS